MVGWSEKASEVVMVYITTKTLKCLVWKKGGEEMGERGEIGTEGGGGANIFNY